LSKILNEPTLKFTAEKSIDPKFVRQLQEIGRGHFGIVFKGKESINWELAFYLFIADFFAT